MTALARRLSMLAELQRPLDPAFVAAFGPLVSYQPLTAWTFPGHE